ncbi:MAG: TAXI family TRAP transporter solute-binding subunit [Dethiosulfatibacter sp.]|nr:TAXI family TRAP transporter solute-binding subunit [Dethiosulfatibacter sp.]
MKKSWKSLVGLLLIVALVGGITVGCSQPTDTSSSEATSGKEEVSFIRIASASMGGNFFPLGSALAQMINQKIEGLNASAQATGGSAENCSFIDQKEVELALVQSATLRQAYEGTDGFEGRPVESIRGITAIYFNEFHILVTESSGVEKIEDLRGKRIAVGPVGGGIEINTNQILSVYGITPSDYTPVYGTRAEATEGLKINSVDCHIYATGLGSAQITELMGTGKIKLIPIDEDKIESLTAGNPEFGPSLIPTDTYENQPSDLTTIAGSSLLVTREDMSEEIIYEITKAIFENSEYLESFHQYFKQTRQETAQIGMTPPLHPGAEKYFKEIGVID